MTPPDDARPLDDDIVSVDELGPFLPPSGYRFEDELQGPPPRLRTDELKRGRYATRRRRGAVGFLVAGAIMTALGPLPFVQTIGLYFLPLAYLTWIGLGVLALGGAALIQNALGRGPYRYVEEGLPIVARVRDLRLVPSAFHDGQPIQYHFDALIEHLDPETGALRTVETKSTDFRALEKDRLTTSYRVGDYATAVYLPHDPEKTLRLYGFLDLHPDLGLIRRGAAPEPTSPIKTALTIVGIVAFFGGLLWNLYAIGRYEPTTISAAAVVPVFAAGSILLGIPLLGYLAAEQSRLRRKREARNAEALARGEPIEPEVVGKKKKAGPFGPHGWFMTVILVLGALLMGGLFSFCGAISLNALLDTSPARPRPVVLDEMIQVTHHAIFREYKIKYHFPDDPATKHEFLSTPAQMDEFAAPLGVAEARDGRFGWPWVEAIRPLRRAPRPIPVEGP